MESITDIKLNEMHLMNINITTCYVIGTEDVYVSEEAPSTDKISLTFKVRPPPCRNKTGSAVTLPAGKDKTVKPYSYTCLVQVQSYKIYKWEKNILR